MKAAEVVFCVEVRSGAGGSYFLPSRSRSAGASCSVAQVDQMRDSSGAVPAPDQKHLSSHLLYKCFVDNQQGLPLYPNPTDLNCERS